MNKYVKLIKIFYVILVIALFCSTEAYASFIQEDQACKVVENWRAKNPNPMNSTMGQAIEDIRHYQGEPYGNPGYYVVFLNPNGWVIVPADDAFEPILAFGSGKLTPELYEISPIRYFFRIDVPIQAFSASSSQGAKITKANIERENRWDILLNSAPVMGAFSLELNPEDNDIVVEPLLNNFWEQDTLKKYENDIHWDVISRDGIYPVPYYNYFTSWDNVPYPVGCNALAMAQVMRKFEYPKEPINSVGRVYEIGVNGISRDVSLKGGSGVGGRYRWDLMPLSPDFSSYKDELLNNVSTDQRDIRNEIAALLHDSGVAIRSEYSDIYEIGTAAFTPSIAEALMDCFRYANACQLPNTYVQPSLKDIINLNLIYGSPVIMAGVVSLDNQTINHTFTLDGYGYESYSQGSGNVEYHHIILALQYKLGDYSCAIQDHRMWFIMHEEDSGYANFINFRLNANMGAIFNIFPTVEDKKKELVGGRLWLGETPFASADISIKYKNENSVESTFPTITSNTKGVFALPVMPSVDIKSILVKSTGTYNISLDIAPLIQSNKLKVGNTIDFCTITSRDRDFSVGNRYFGDINIDTAVIRGVEYGIQNGLRTQYDYPFFYAVPSLAGANWKFTGLKALYVDPYPYDRYLAQAWYSSLCTGIRDFVVDGGTVYLTGESHSIARFLSNQAGAGLTFYANPPFPIYQGNGNSKILLVGSLQEDVGLSNVDIPFIPYDAGGPLISNFNGSITKELAKAEVAHHSGGIPTGFGRYTVAVSFKLGRGAVY